jgi:hypothetical protein
MAAFSVCASAMLCPVVGTGPSPPGIESCEDIPEDGVAFPTAPFAACAEGLPSGTWPACVAPRLLSWDTGSPALFACLPKLDCDREEIDVAELFGAAWDAWAGEKAERIASANALPPAAAPGLAMADAGTASLDGATSMAEIEFMQALSPVEGDECRWRAKGHSER